MHLLVSKSSNGCCTSLCLHRLVQHMCMMSDRVLHLTADAFNAGKGLSQRLCCSHDARWEP